MTKLAPEWVGSSDPVIRSPARYRWTTTPALEFSLKRNGYRMIPELSSILSDHSDPHPPPPPNKASNSWHLRCCKNPEISHWFTTVRGECGTKPSDAVPHHDTDNTHNRVNFHLSVLNVKDIAHRRGLLVHTQTHIEILHYHEGNPNFSQQCHIPRRSWEMYQCNTVKPVFKGHPSWAIIGEISHTIIIYRRQEGGCASIRRCACIGINTVY